MKSGKAEGRVDGDPKLVAFPISRSWKTPCDEMRWDACDEM